MEYLAEPQAEHGRKVAEREQHPRQSWPQVPRYHVVIYHWPWCRARWGGLRDCDCEALIGVEEDS
ncbi:MAG: hypothetical protein GX601_18180 [Anaerolineales bacterium]|nr:hypothetical protein [Anaerolineales bacterium]